MEQDWAAIKTLLNRGHVTPGPAMGSLSHLETDTLILTADNQGHYIGGLHRQGIGHRGMLKFDVFAKDISVTPYTLEAFTQLLEKTYRQSDFHMVMSVEGQAGHLFDLATSLVFGQPALNPNDQAIREIADQMLGFLKIVPPPPKPFDPFNL